MGSAIEVANGLAADEVAQLWPMYEQAFGQLAVSAVQRHLMYEDEFGKLMADPRVWKFVARDDVTGELHGLAAYTNDLDAVELVSRPYFEFHYPDELAEGRIWYVMFVAIAEAAPLSAFPALITSMYHFSGEDRAVTILDVCAKMADDGKRHLPRSVRALLQRLAGRVFMHRLDEQSYWALWFPPRTRR